MKKNVFYSWQSDLPNNVNRGFIQRCIEKAVQSIGKEKLHLEIAVDRDTKGMTGTPDIAASIFEKIDNTNIFIADISIINAASPERKTPNPNVLIELGYAAKTIGWSHIICIFNTAFGKIEDLPFDLRFRRPITYKIENVKDKNEDKSNLIDRIKAEIMSIVEKETPRDEIQIYIKHQVDKEIRGIGNQIFTIVFGYEEELTPDSIWKLISLTPSEIDKEFSKRKHLGFSVLKDWKDYWQRLEKIMNQPFFNHHAERKYISALIKVIRALEAMATVCSDPKLFIETTLNEEGYKIVDGKELNNDNPEDSYSLFKNIADSDTEIEADFGIIRKYNIERVLKYHTINDDGIFGYLITIEELLQAIRTWISNTGNYLFLDPLTYRF